MIARFLFALLLLVAMPAFAADSIAMRAGVHADHDRLVMDWGQSVSYQLSGDAPDYILSFTGSGNLKIPNLSRLKRFGAVTKTSDNPLVLTIRLAPNNNLRVSRMGHKIVMDAVQGKKEATKNEPPKEKSQKENSKALEKKPPVPPTSAVVPKGAEELRNQIVTLDKWSGAQDAGGPPPGAKTPETKPEEKKPDTVPVIQGNTGPGGRPLTLAEIAARDAQKPPEKKPEDKNAENKNPDDKKPDEAKAAGVPVPEEQFIPLPTDLTEPTAIAQIKIKVPPKVKFAAYMRGKKLWVVLDQPNTSNPTDEGDGEPTKFGPVTRYQVGQGSGTAYRIQLQDNQFPAVTKADADVLLFTIYSQSPLVMPLGAPIAVKPSNDQGPRLEISGAGFASPLRVSDPDVGDNVFVIPSAPDAGSVTDAYRWPQLVTIPAIHGIVISPLVDNISVDTNPSGVIIARPPKGLVLSGVKGLIRNRDAGTGAMIFDLPRWRIGATKNYRRTKAQLESALADIRGSERLGRIMQIAQFEFAHGYGPEANGWLRIAAQEFPDVLRVPDYMLLRGAVRTTMRDSFAADKDLAQTGYAYEPEIALWRGLAAAQTENFQRARYFFALGSTLLHDYPDPYFARMGLAASETALLTGDAVAGQALIEGLEKRKDSLSPADRGQVSYLKAVAAHLNGKTKEAEEFWQQAIKSPNAIYAAKSQIMLIQEQIKNKTLKPEEAIKTLEHLRFTWRGDRTEIATLLTLADLYINTTNNQRPAFENWQTIIRYFPAEPQAEIARQNISKNFVDMFAPEHEDQLQPVEALALYRDFINYAPTPESREQIARHLIDRLVNVGMYHEAADVFSQIVRLPQPGVPVPPPSDPRDVLRLAGIQLLDNLSAKARETLTLADVNTLQPAQQVEYRLLSARADFQDGKLDNALETLAPLSDLNSQRLRADIYWKKQDWLSVAKTLPILIGPVGADGKLSPQQSRIILQQAIALSLANDPDNLAALREKYASAMDASEQAASFRLITRPPKGSESQSIQAIQSHLGEVDGFSDFLKNYQKTETKPPATDPAAK